MPGAPSHMLRPAVKQTFPIEPASSASLWFIIPITVLLLFVVGLMLYNTYSLYNLRVVLDEEALEVRGDLYGRRIPLAQLLLDEARIIDLDQEKDYALSWRTNGVGMPGYQSGWFRLRNGEKALVFVTQAQRVVRIPTTEGYTLLVEPASAEAFLEALRAHGAGVT